MFGAFYNVDLEHPYCSLFPDLEPGSVGNVLFFKPKDNQIILANPPYTKEWIKWTIKNVLEWKNTIFFTCYFVIPIWDRKTRDQLGLTKYPDFPEINTLIDNASEAKVENLEFFDGINTKYVHLKDKIHVIKIN